MENIIRFKVMACFFIGMAYLPVINHNFGYCFPACGFNPFSGIRRYNTYESLPYLGIILTVLSLIDKIPKFFGSKLVGKPLFSSLSLPVVHFTHLE